MTREQRLEVIEVRQEEAQNLSCLALALASNPDLSAGFAGALKALASALGTLANDIGEIDAIHA